MLKKVNYQGGDFAIIAEFGQGDLLVGAASSTTGSAVIIQNNDECEKIGTLHYEQAGQSVDTIPGNKIMLTFSNVQSIDVVMESLMEARQFLIDNPTEIF